MYSAKKRFLNTYHVLGIRPAPRKREINHSCYPENYDLEQRLTNYRPWAESSFIETHHARSFVCDLWLFLYSGSGVEESLLRELWSPQS